MEEMARRRDAAIQRKTEEERARKVEEERKAKEELERRKNEVGSEVDEGGSVGVGREARSRPISGRWVDDEGVVDERRIETWPRAGQGQARRRCDEESNRRSQRQHLGFTKKAMHSRAAGSDGQGPGGRRSWRGRRR